MSTKTGLNVRRFRLADKHDPAFSFPLRERLEICLIREGSGDGGKPRRCAPSAVPKALLLGTYRRKSFFAEQLGLVPYLGRLGCPDQPRLSGPV